MKVRVVTARPEHAEQLAAVMRAEDLAECQAAGYATGLEALRAGIEGSTEAWAVYFGGELGAVLGVDAEYGTPEQPGALIWALTGKVVDRARLAFVHASRELVAWLLERHRFLFNLVDPRYVKALRWLELLGFKQGHVVPYPGTGAPFVLVTLGGA